MKSLILLTCVVVGVLHAPLLTNSWKLLESRKFPATQSPCPSNFTGMIPNPEDCHSFYICDDGFPGLIPCPANLCFNPSNEACDHCNLVPGCESATPPSPPPSSSTQPPQTSSSNLPSSSPQEPSSQPPSSSSTQAPTIPSSPSTPAPSTSSNSPTAPTERTTTPDGGIDLPCPDVPYVYMPYPNDCNRFYYCINGSNVGTYNCGVGLWFNYQQQACTPPWGESCS